MDTKPTRTAHAPLPETLDVTLDIAPVPAIKVVAPCQPLQRIRPAHAIQRIGIVPDIEVRPTIEGIRAGRDEVLDAAIAEIHRE